MIGVLPSRSYHSSISHHMSRWGIPYYSCIKLYRICRNLHHYLYCMSLSRIYGRNKNRCSNDYFGNQNSFCTVHLDNENFQEFCGHIHKCCTHHLSFSGHHASMSRASTCNFLSIVLYRIVHKYSLHHLCKYHCFLNQCNSF